LLRKQISCQALRIRPRGQAKKGNEAAAALAESEAAREAAAAEAAEARSAAAALQERLEAGVRECEALSREVEALRAGVKGQDQAAAAELQRSLSAAEAAAAAAHEQLQAADAQLAQKQEALSKAEAQVCARGHAMWHPPRLRRGIVRLVGTCGAGRAIHAEFWAA